MSDRTYRLGRLNLWINRTPVRGIKLCVGLRGIAFTVGRSRVGLFYL